ncbi:hypothetical protein BGZ76_006256, partial [Entomortierella beljakovae]
MTSVDMFLITKRTSRKRAASSSFSTKDLRMSMPSLSPKISTLSSSVYDTVGSETEANELGQDMQPNTVGNGVSSCSAGAGGIAASKYLIQDSQSQEEEEEEEQGFAYS